MECISFIHLFIYSSFIHDDMIYYEGPFIAIWFITTTPRINHDTDSFRLAMWRDVFKTNYTSVFNLADVGNQVAYIQWLMECHFGDWYAATCNRVFCE